MAEHGREKLTMNRRLSITLALTLALGTLAGPTRAARGASPADIPRGELVVVRAEQGVQVAEEHILGVLRTGGAVERVPDLDLQQAGWEVYWTKGRSAVLPAGISGVAGVARAWRPLTWAIPREELEARSRAEPVAVAGGGVGSPEREPFWAQLWNLRAVAAWPAGWMAATGLYGRALVIDTGVDCTHVDLRCAETDHYDAVRRMPTFNPTDRLGHGTHVAGIIGAIENARGVIGVAPDAEILSCKACSDGGTCNELDVAACVVWGVGAGVDVMNMSLGGPPGSSTPELCEVLAWARGQGVLTVASVGNGGSRQQLYPATCGGVVGVAASIPPDGDRIADYSQRASVDLTAPGSEILSTLPSGRWGYLSGTSMAAPHVSGAGLLMREAMGDAWDPDLAAQYLYDNARRICGAVYQGSLCGWGALDVDAALRAWMPVAPTAAATATTEAGETPTTEPTPTSPPTATHVPAVQTAIIALTLTALPRPATATITPTLTLAPTETGTVAPATATLTPSPTRTRTASPSPSTTATIDPVAATVTALWPTATPDVEATLTALAPTPDRVATAVWATLRAPGAAATRAAGRRRLWFPLLIRDLRETVVAPSPFPTEIQCVPFPWICPEATLMAQRTMEARWTAIAEETERVTRTPPTPTAVWPGYRLPMLRRAR